MKKITLFSLLFSSLSFGQTDLLLEDFQSGIPVNYSIVDNDGLTPASAVAEYVDAWIGVSDPADTSNKVAGSTSYFSPVGRADRWLITPQITLGAYGNFISWQAKSHDASYPDSYQVLISTTTNDISSFTDTIGSIDQEFNIWQYREANLSEAGYDNQQVYLAFVNKTYDGFKLYIDSIHVWKEDPVGLTEISASNAISIYPNPAQSSISISSPSTLLDNVKIYNTSGSLVIESNNNDIDVSALPNGVYFVEVRDNKSILRSKFIKN